MHVRTSNVYRSLTSPTLARPLRPAKLLLEAKGEGLRDGGKPCVAMPLKMACRMANTRELEFSSRTFTCHTINSTSGPISRMQIVSQRAITHLRELFYRLLFTQIISHFSREDKQDPLHDSMHTRLPRWCCNCRQEKIRRARL